MINLCISNIFLFVNLKFFYSKLFELKKENKWISLTYAICIITSIVLNFYMSINVKFILITLLMLILSIILYKGAFIKKLIALFSFLLITSIVELLCANLFYLFTNNDASSDINSSYFLLGTIISYITLFMLILVFNKLLSIHLNRQIPIYSWIILILPITTTTLIANLNNYAKLIKHNIIFSMILLGLILSNFITIYIFFKVIDYLEYKRKNTIMKMNEQYLKSRYILLEQQYNQNFILLHDILKKSIHLNNLLEKKKYKTLKSELVELTNKTFQEFNTLFTNSDIINNIINNKLSELKKYSIEIRSTITYNNFSFLKRYDQMLFFSNLLDFTIHACKFSKDEQKIIILKTYSIKDSIGIQFLYNKSSVYNDETYNELLQYLIFLEKEYDFIYSIDNTSLKYSDSILFLFNSDHISK